MSRPAKCKTVQIENSIKKKRNAKKKAEKSLKIKKITKLKKKYTGKKPGRKSKLKTSSSSITQVTKSNVGRKKKSNNKVSSTVKNSIAQKLIEYFDKSQMKIKTKLLRVRESLEQSKSYSTSQCRQKIKKLEKLEQNCDKQLQKNIKFIETHISDQQHNYEEQVDKVQINKKNKDIKKYVESKIKIVKEKSKRGRKKKQKIIKEVEQVEKKKRKSKKKKQKEIEQQIEISENQNIDEEVIESDKNQESFVSEQPKSKKRLIRKDVIEEKVSQIIEDKLEISQDKDINEESVLSN